MKKLIMSFLGLILIVFSLVGCGNNDVSDDNLPIDDTPAATESAGVIIHYNRPDQSYSNWGLWLWEESKEGFLVEFNGSDSYGAYAKYEWNTFSTKLDNQKLGFIVRQLDDWVKDVESDRFIDFSALKFDHNGYYNVYLKFNDEEVYTSDSGEVLDLIQYFDIAYNATLNQIKLWFQTNKAFKSYEITLGSDVVYSSTTQNDNPDLLSYSDTKIVYELKSLPDLSQNYKLKVVFKDSGKTVEKVVNNAAVYKTKAFVDSYTYTGDLGAIYSKTSTTFRVWSPVSSNIKLRVYNTGTPASLGGSDTYTEHQMTKGEKGTWQFELAGDQGGKYYTYVVTNYLYTNKEIVDPYAKSTGINGLRGMIVDFEKTNPTSWDNVNVLNIPSTKLTVYETHIADLTSSSTWNGTVANAKTYKGFYETGTTYTKNNTTVTTGFDHIKELGVNAVQILPFFDQANKEALADREFNWGYNPLNYNSLEGSYSSDPTDGYVKIREFKELVAAYNAAGINIIMDVVYNHVNSLDGSNFDVLMPNYYFRYTSTGASNGSGCGNETASEMPMFRKFMMDSTEFWVSEYKLGGFRFDLMGIHDVETMNLLSANLHENVSEHVVVYGEPWAAGTIALPGEYTPATQINMNKYEGYGCFNDKIRDALIKGGLSAPTEKGWITNTTSAGSISDIISGIQGVIVSGNIKTEPEKCINYVTCHDNYTLYDRIKASGITDDATIKKMAMLSNSIVFTSQGVSFMLAGEEFLRTKDGNENSYNASYKINELNYELKVDNIDMFNNYKKLISLKQNGNIFNQTSATFNRVEVTANANNSMISYKIVDQETNKEYIIIHSNGVSGTKTANLAGYQLYLDTLNVTGLSLTESTTIQDYQTIIAYKQL